MNKVKNDVRDIVYDGKDFHYIYRVGALIYNYDKSKVLLYYGNNADFYMLPGGKVKVLETSKKAIKRELKEELGFDNLEFDFAGISEEIIKDNVFNVHQLTLIYKCIYNGRITETNIKGKDSDYNNFEWIDIQDLKKLKTHPKEIYTLIENDNIIKHIVEEINE